MSTISGLTIPQMEEMLLKLREALYAGASSISVAGRTISFDSQNEMLNQIQDLQNKIAMAKGETPTKWFQKSSYRPSRKRF